MWTLWARAGLVKLGTGNRDSRTRAPKRLPRRSEYCSRMGKGGWIVVLSTIYSCISLSFGACAAVEVGELKEVGDRVCGR